MVQYSTKPTLLHLCCRKTKVLSSPPPSLQSLCCPYFLSVTDTTNFVFWNFLTVWTFCIYLKLYKPLQSVGLIVWIYLLAVLFLNYIQFFQYRTWCFLTKKIRTVSGIYMLSIEMEWKHWLHMLSVLKFFHSLKTVFVILTPFMHINSIYKMCSIIM